MAVSCGRSGRSHQRVAASGQGLDGIRRTADSSWLSRNSASRRSRASPFALRPGMRGISIGVDRENAVGGAVKEGDRVDVIATFNAAEFSAVQLAPPTTATTPTRRLLVATPGSTTSTTISRDPHGSGHGPLTCGDSQSQTLTGFDLTQTVSAMSITILQQAEVLAMDILLPVDHGGRGPGRSIGRVTGARRRKFPICRSSPSW